MPGAWSVLSYRFRDKRRFWWKVANVSHLHVFRHSRQMSCPWNYVTSLRLKSGMMMWRCVRLFNANISTEQTDRWTKMVKRYRVIKTSIHATFSWDRFTGTKQASLLQSLSVWCVSGATLSFIKAILRIHLWIGPDMNDKGQSSGT